MSYKKLVIMNVKHIHEVLFLFQEKGKYANEEELFASIKQRHGDDVQFISCSNQPFGLDAVVPFLLDREKIIRNTDGSLQLHPTMTMCDGHEHHH